MPISAPPPRWESIKDKPTTVGGYGITDMASQSVANATNASNVPWTGVSSKPTTVAGLGLTDFNAQAIAAQASLTAGDVGTYAFMGEGSLSALTENGATRAGSALRFAGILGAGGWGNAGEFALAGGLGNGTPAGTWRCMGRSYGSASRASATLWLRIA